ncbi:MAG: YggS family pyridoxal phosphate-dependent enzyme [Flavipsychrobacter sp.]
MVNKQVWLELQEQFKEKEVTLVAVSKKKPVADIQEFYDLGERNFGENYVQELVEKQPQLPADINWHYIGHLQTNKVKYIAPFVHLIHAVDSFKLLKEIDKQAKKNDRVINVLLQMHVAEEESKFGLNAIGIIELLDYYQAQKEELNNVNICGLMGMGTFTEDEAQLRAEFSKVHAMFLNLKNSYFLDSAYFKECSMGMSGDYNIAIEEGSTMVRIGSMLFGARSY